MEQDNSLNASIQELINIEKEQMRILNEMNGRDSAVDAQFLMNQAAEHSRIEQAASAQSSPNIQNTPNPNMYMYASNNMQGAVGPNTNYGPPALTYDPQTGQMRRQQFKEYANSITGNQNNYGFISSLIPPNSRTSNEARTLTAMDAGYRVSQAAIAGLGAIGTAGATWAIGGAMAGSGIGGFLGSMALTGGISAGVGLYTDMAIDEIKQQAAYRKYLTQNSYMFINPNESENDRDIAGFSKKQTKEAATFLRGLANDTYLKDEEIMTLTQKFTEGGLLKDTKDLETFKKQMTALTKSVKTGALILNETYENIAEVLSEFKKLGLDQKDFNQTLSGIKINAANLGIDASKLTEQVLNYLTNLNYGTGNSNANTYSRLEDTTLYTSNLYEELSKIPDYKKTQKEKAAFNMIKNLGGTDKAAEYLNTMQEKILDNELISKQIAGYFFDYDAEKKNWSLNQGKFTDFLSSDKTFGQIANVVSQKFAQLNEQGNGAAVTEFMANAGTYMRNSMTDGDVAKTIQGAINALLRDESYGGNGYDTTKILSDIFEIKDSGAQNLLGTYLDYRIGKGDDLGYQFKQQKRWTEVVNATKAKTPGIGEWIGSKWDGFKESITKLPVTIGDWFSDVSTGISDWWYTKKNGVAPPKLKETFEIETLKYGTSSMGVALSQRESLGNIGRVSESLNRLKEKGYTLDDEISKLAENAMNSFNNHIIKARKRIYDWEQVDEGVAARKDEITNISANTGLSEVILSALVKYDQTNNTDKVLGEALKSVAESLSQAVNKYQGNETLGLLSSYAGVDVDGILKEQFNIDINKLTSADIEKLKNLKIDDIELSDETKAIIKQLLNVDLSKGAQPGQQVVVTSTQEGGYAVNYSATGTTKKNEDIIKLAAEKYSFSEAAFAALLSTENESGEDHSVNSAGARGAAQVTEWTKDYAGAVDVVTGEVWDGSMASVTGEANNSMNISVGAAEYDDYLNRYAKGNAFIAYGMYNGGPTGFGNILRSAGYSEDQWANLTGNQIMNILNTYKPDTEYQAAMRRYIQQLEKVTGDSGVGDVSGTEVNTGVTTTTTRVDEQGREYVVNNGIRTYVEYTEIDPNKTPEENAKLKELQDGIVTSSVSQSRFNFLSQVKGVIDAKESDYKGMINDLVKQDGNAGAYAEYVKTLINKGYSYEQIQRTSDYQDYREAALKNGGEDTLKVLDKIDSIVSAWSKYGGSGYDEKKKYETEELREGAKARFESSEKLKNQYVLEKYGESVGLTLEGFDGDLGKYNAALTETARTFVQGGTNQITEFLNWKNNDKDSGKDMSSTARAFNDMSATDKLALLSTMDVVNGALGKDVTGIGSVKEVLSQLISGLSDEEVAVQKDEVVKQKKARIEEIDDEINSELKEVEIRTDGKPVKTKKKRQKLEALEAEKKQLQADLEGDKIENDIRDEKISEAILSDKDKELMKYLHKDKKGNIYYDSTLEGKEKMTIQDLAAWEEQGEKKVKYSRAKTLLEQEQGVILGDLSFNDAIDRAKKMYSDVKLQFTETAAEASAAVGNISNSFLQDKLSAFLQSNDLQGMNNFLTEVKEGKVTDANGNVISTEGSEEAIERLSQALSKLQDSADVQEIMSLITELTRLNTSLKDVATAARDTYEGLDAGTQHNTDEGIADDVKNLLRALADNESRKTEGEKDGTYQELLQAIEDKKMTPESVKEAILQGLENGKGLITIGDEEFKLNSDTLLELGDIISKNMDEAIKESLKGDTNYGDGDGGIDKLVSGREKEIASAMGLSIDELKEELSKLAKQNSELATSIDTQSKDYEQLKTDRDQTVEEIFKGYSESMKGYKETGEKAIDGFSKAIAKYDDEFTKAIRTLESRVNEKGFLINNIISTIMNPSSPSVGSNQSGARNGGTIRD